MKRNIKFEIRCIVLVAFICFIICLSLLNLKNQGSILASIVMIINAACLLLLLVTDIKKEITKPKE